MAVINFFSGGGRGKGKSGRGSGPINYLLDELVSKEGIEYTREPAPVVVAGDPELTRLLIDSCQNHLKYTSGVIAYEIGDDPTEEEQLQCIEDFEKLAFAGLQSDQYNILWVRHLHEGNVELHFVSPRLELSTGKALNIRPPGKATTAAFDALRDKWNHEKGWADPTDPARARMSNHDLPDHGAPVLKDGKQAKEAITTWLTAKIEDGLVKNRDDVIASLKEIGEITRAGDDYISVKPAGFAKAVRLKGVLYGREFSVESVEKVARENPERSGNRRSIDDERAKHADKKLQRAIESRAAFNVERHKARDGEQSVRVDDVVAEKERGVDQRIEQHTQSHIEELAANVERFGDSSQPGAIKTEISDIDSDNHVSDLLTDMRVGLGSDALVGKHDKIADHRDSGSQNYFEQVASISEISVKRDRELPDIEVEAGILSDKVRGICSDIAKLMEKTYDRVRNAVIENIGRFADTARAAYEKLAGRFSDFVSGKRREFKEVDVTSEQLKHSVDAATKRQSEIGRGIEVTERKIDRACSVMKENRNDELEAFKSKINLTEFVAGKGYALDKNKSTKNVHVMRKDDDKIVIATANDGHGIYFSARDDNDNGTIIDFIQRREGLNLGEVRKELRQWVGKSAQVPEVQRQRKPEPVEMNQARVLAKFALMEPVNGKHDYLESRGITQKTLSDDRFSSMIKSDQRGNAIFPHYNSQGITGYEIKNHGFTGFSEGGNKAIWISSNLKRAETIYICESAIDALSHAELKSTGSESAYMSIGGQPSKDQWNIIQTAIKQAIERNQKVVFATDGDVPGEQLAEKLKAIAGGSGERDKAPHKKDWNDELQAVIRHQARLGVDSAPSGLRPN